MRRNRSLVLATCAALCAAGIVFAADTPESKPATPPAKPAPRRGLEKPAPPAAAPATTPAAPGDDALAQIGFDRSAEVDSAAPAAPKPSAAVPHPRTEFKPVVKKNATGKDVVVITNEQLEHLYGRSNPPAVAQSEPADAAAPAQAGGGAQGGAAANGDNDPAHLRAELDRLDRKAKYLKNPFLQPPPLTEQELAADRNLTKTQALERTQQQMEKLKQQLKASEAPAANANEHK